MKRLTQLPLFPGFANLVDSHIHLDSKEYSEDWRDVYARAAERSVTRCVIPATNLASAERIREMCAERPGLFPTAGIHPHQAAEFDENTIPRLRELLPGCVALGETGLEAFYDFCPWEKQLDSLRPQLQLAREMDKPVILHCRDCEEALYNETVGNRGVVHCFTGSWEWAQKFLDRGFYLGVNGLVTLPKAENVQEVARKMPLDRMLLETDGPYLAPKPHRGYRNEPALVPLIAMFVSELRGCSITEVAQTTTRNSEKLFGLKTGIR